MSDVLMPEVSGLAFYDDHAPIEERGVPDLQGDDLKLVLDAVRLVPLRKLPPL